jgi:hypothetical protein
MATKWPDGEILELLERHGFKLERQIKHMVWRNSEGKVYVCSTSPSDVFAYKKALGELKRVIGINKTEHTQGERRERKRRAKAQATSQTFTVQTSAAARPTMADQLSKLFKKE